METTTITICHEGVELKLKPQAITIYNINKDVCALGYRGADGNNVPVLFFKAQLLEEKEKAE